jgi:hypothetical protein
MVGIRVEVNQVFGRLDCSYTPSHDLSEKTVYIPSTSFCCYDQQRVITPSDHDVLIAVLDRGLAACSHLTKTARNGQYDQLLE